MERLRDLREDRDLKQGEIAEFLMVTQTTYSRYENGVLGVPIDVLQKLAIYYNTSIDYLVGLTDDKDSYERKSDSVKRILEME